MLGWPSKSRMETWYDVTWFHKMTVWLHNILHFTQYFWTKPVLKLLLLQNLPSLERNTGTWLAGSRWCPLVSVFEQGFHWKWERKTRKPLFQKYLQQVTAIGDFKEQRDWIHLHSSTISQHALLHGWSSLDYVSCSYLCTPGGTSERSWRCWNVAATLVGRSPSRRWTGSSGPGSGWWCLAARHHCSWFQQVSQRWRCNRDLCCPETLLPWQRRPTIVEIQAYMATFSSHAWIKNNNPLNQDVSLLTHPKLMAAKPVFNFKRKKEVVTDNWRENKLPMESLRAAASSRIVVVTLIHISSDQFTIIWLRY